MILVILIVYRSKQSCKRHTQIRFNLSGTNATRRTLSPCKSASNIILNILASAKFQLSFELLKKTEQKQLEVPEECLS